MKQAVIRNNSIIIEENTTPTLNEKGAIVKILGCGLCGSDIVKFKQKISKAGTVLGHEIVGIIDKIDSDTNFKVGDKVVMGHHIPCGNCVYCQNQNYSMCKHFKSTNIKPGGFAQYIFASEEHLKNTAFKIPEELTEIEASFMEPLGCIVRAVRRANLKPQQSALIIGLGSIGLLMGQAVRSFGIKAYGADLIQERVDLAKSLNFDESINSKSEDEACKKILELTDGYGVDAIFMTSGSSKAINFALKSVRSGGKIIVFSSVPNFEGYPNNEIYYRELEIMGSYSPSPNDLEYALELLKTNKVIVKNLSTIYNFENINEAIDDTLKNKILKAYIKI